MWCFPSLVSRRWMQIMIPNIKQTGQKVGTKNLMKSGSKKWGYERKIHTGTKILADSRDIMDNKYDE